MKSRGSRQNLEGWVRRKTRQLRPCPNRLVRHAGLGRLAQRRQDHADAEASGLKTAHFWSRTRPNAHSGYRIRPSIGVAIAKRDTEVYRVGIRTRIRVPAGLLT